VSSLNERMIEGAVLFATRHKSKPSQIGKHGTGSILAKDMEQRAFL
jgi:hypothetical protein